MQREMRQRTRNPNPKLSVNGGREDGFKREKVSEVERECRVTE